MICVVWRNADRFDSDGALRDALRRLLFVGFSMGLVKEGADMEEGTLEIGIGE